MNRERYKNNKEVQEHENITLLERSIRSLHIRLFNNQLLLNLRYRLRWIQPLWAHRGTIHNCVTAIEGEFIFQFSSPLLPLFISAI